MSVASRTIAAALAEIAREEHVRAASADTDLLVDGVAARWLVRPGSLEEVARVVALATEETLAVVPRGSGSALDLGHPPSRADVLLDLRRLDRVVEYTPEDVTISVEAGVTAAALATRLAKHGQWLPLDPPGAAGRTLGGLAATGATGPLRARYGTLRDALLGVRFVQADGVLTWGGARVVKSVSGYDVPKLMIGSLGTLGVLGELTLRLHPRPEAETTWLARFAAPAAARAFLAATLDSTLEPARLELLNAPVLERCGVTASALGVAVTIASTGEAVAEQGERLVRLASAGGGECRPAPADFWARWDGGWADAGGVRLRVGTVPSELVVVAEGVEDRARRAGGCALLSGCAPAGVLDAHLVGLPLDGVRALVDAVRSQVAAVDGGVVVQRAPRELRATLDPWGPVEAATFTLMRGLKDEFDPRRVLNPGRFVGGL